MGETAWLIMYGAPVPTLCDPTPSPEDVAVTGTIFAAGKLLDITLLDHLVIGNRGFVSLRAQKLGFPEP
jgi:hypothetical protein